MAVSAPQCLCLYLVAKRSSLAFHWHGQPHPENCPPRQEASAKGRKLVIGLQGQFVLVHPAGALGSALYPLHVPGPSLGSSEFPLLCPPDFLLRSDLLLRLASAESSVRGSVHSCLPSSLWLLAVEADLLCYVPFILNGSSFPHPGS